MFSLRLLFGKHPSSPWYIVPVYDKENTRLIVSQIVVDTLSELKMEYPKTTEKRRQELEIIRKQLKELRWNQE